MHSYYSHSMERQIGGVYERDERVIEWRIEPFFGLSEKVDIKYYSPAFSFANESWYLSVYPNGEREHKSEGHIGLYLYRKYPGPPISLEYTLGLKNVQGGIDEDKDHTYSFQQVEGFGYSEFLSRSELLEKKSELVPYNVMTVVCILKYPANFEMVSKEVTTACCFCEVTLDAQENVSSHLQKCEFPTKCPKCGDVVALKNWHNHQCQTMGTEGLKKTAAIKCSYCQITLGDREDISSHLQKCNEFPLKCPKCGDVAALKNWHDHKCQKTEMEGFKKTAAIKCSYCQITLADREDISSHLQKCKEFLLKCPKCGDVFNLKNWHDHKCQTTEKGENNDSSSSSTILHENKILEDFKQLFLRQENCDVILRVKEKEFLAHKTILQARSPVFASTFLHDMKEKATGIVDIEDCDPSVFPDFLCFLYCQDMDSISKESVTSLFTVADKYDVPDLRAKCVEFMKENLSVDTFCDTITLALQHSVEGLVNLATDFFIRNAEKIVVTVKWQAFAVKYPIQSNELVIKFIASVKPLNVSA